MNPTPSMYEIDVIIEDAEWHPLCANAAFLATAAATAALADALTPADQSCELSIVLASDARLRALNRDYRGIDKPTNVLSFPAEPEAAGDQGPRLLGDVIVARETVQREALAGGLSPGDHLSHLVVHGVLHLLGYDHEYDAEAVKMEALETVILARLGIANPYALMQQL